jgi:hypothetical protein
VSCSSVQERAALTPLDLIKSVSHALPEGYEESAPNTDANEIWMRTLTPS